MSLTRKVLFLLCALAHSVPLRTLCRLRMYVCNHAWSFPSAGQLLCTCMPFVPWMSPWRRHTFTVDGVHFRMFCSLVCIRVCTGTVRESSQHARVCHCVRRSQCQLSAGLCLSVCECAWVCVWACVVCVCVCIPLNVCLHCNSVSVCMRASVYFNTQGIPSLPVMSSLPSLITLMNVRPCSEQFSPWVNNA